jgi:hypothetical protein
MMFRSSDVYSENQYSDYEGDSQVVHIVATAL